MDPLCTYSWVKFLQLWYHHLGSPKRSCRHMILPLQRPEILAPKIISYVGSDIAFSPYGDYWKQMRKVCMLELLSAKRVQSFHSLREEEISSLIESIQSSSGSPTKFTKKKFLFDK
ncbi:hypothetical protein ACJW30_06G174700 [Castanea mollissima]